MGKAIVMRHKESVGYKIRLIHNCIHKQMEAKRIENEGDITGIQRYMVGYLNEHLEEDIYQKDIEQEFKVSRATVSQILQTMEKRGMIAKESVAHDARLKKIMLTEKAKNMVQKADADVLGMEEIILKGFDEGETKQLKEYLERIMQNVGVTEECERNEPSCDRKNSGGKKKDYNI